MSFFIICRFLFYLLLILLLSISIHCTRHVEKQFSYTLCLKVLQNSKIPLIFKRQYLRLMQTLYIERLGYTHLVYFYLLFFCVTVAVCMYL